MSDREVHRAASPKMRTLRPSRKGGVRRRRRISAGRAVDAAVDRPCPKVTRRQARQPSATTEWSAAPSGVDQRFGDHDRTGEFRLGDEHLGLLAGTNCVAVVTGDADASPSRPAALDADADDAAAEQALRQRAQADFGRLSDDDAARASSIGEYQTPEPPR
jgi:hypothetical protein